MYAKATKDVTFLVSLFYASSPKERGSIGQIIKILSNVPSPGISYQGIW